MNNKQDIEAKELSKSIFDQMEIDMGKFFASYMGQDTKDMTDEEALQWTKANMLVQFEDECPECGQSFP
tara:strand:+ start:155 stop:361 length:207 start_codon:yes stop_codon:yes gene_type:complete